MIVEEAEKVADAASWWALRKALDDYADAVAAVRGRAPWSPQASEAWERVGLAREELARCWQFYFGRPLPYEW